MIVEDVKLNKSKYIFNKTYKEFIENIKKDIIRARQITIRKVNSELINLYYKIGKTIVIKQKNMGWGEDLIGQIEKDLKKEFPDMKGFSRTNLFYMKKLYLFSRNNTIIPQLVGQIPWGHTRIILDKLKNVDEAMFYARETISNNWSRSILEHQIELNLYERRVNKTNNFELTLNKNEAELVSQYFKETYILDFLKLSKKAQEKDLEAAIISNIVSFLMELGKGFAFIGKQHKIVVGGEEFFIDLLFYNYVLKRFIVVELKTTSFKPEHIGQLGFYMTVINKDFKTSKDKDTIGLLVCKSKNKTVVEYALSNNKKPLGVAKYELNKIPENILKYLPKNEDIKKLLNTK